VTNGKVTAKDKTPKGKTAAKGKVAKGKVAPKRTLAAKRNGSHRKKTAAKSKR
jgi:hypothetical protein